MGMAAGGKIKQTIDTDYFPKTWDPSLTTVFNLQILNSRFYSFVTGEEPRRPVIHAAIYAKYGLPFFEFPEEASGVYGDFSKVKSIAEIEDRVDKEVTPKVVPAKACKCCLLKNPAGPLREFRTVHDIVKELAEMKIAEL
jgi:hypothetical protein